ncbi:hypothetical protein ATCC90586_005248 [Pythium insidiosum]|nr:hypothetical protein ATCC90586_005248 [Pythium insidiosum]
MERSARDSRCSLCGFDAATDLFTIALSAGDNLGRGRCIERRVQDLQALDRCLQRLPSQSLSETAAVPAPRLSLRRLKKLTATSWTRGDRSRGWRDEFRKNVSALDDWLARCLESLGASDEWRRFADDDAYAAHQRARQAARQSEQRARQLQQFFTSAPLIAELLDVLGTHLASDSPWSWDREDVLFVEPSCGDGRVVSALVEIGARHVVAFEVDPALSEQARSSLPPAVAVVHADFLTSRRPERAPSTVIAVGNPPFGEFTRDPTSVTKRDLVPLFVRHLAVEWRATSSCAN